MESSKSKLTRLPSTAIDFHFDKLISGRYNLHSQMYNGQTVVIWNFPDICLRAPWMKCFTRTFDCRLIDKISLQLQACLSSIFEFSIYKSGEHSTPHSYSVFLPSESFCLIKSCFLFLFLYFSPQVLPSPFVGIFLLCIIGSPLGAQSRGMGASTCSSAWISMDLRFSSEPLTFHSTSRAKIHFPYTNSVDLFFSCTAPIIYEMMS